MGSTITTTLHATGERAVPVSFGFHPYLRLPGTDRATWQLDAAVAQTPRDGRTGHPDGPAR